MERKMQNIEQAIGYTFQNKSLLFDALNHSSIKKHANQFERLEFFGDRVLGLVISEYLFENFKKNNEGSLAKMQSAFVCADACYKVALQIELPKSVQTSSANLKNNKTVLSDTIEAILAAVFIDSDFDNVKKIILNLWKNIFDNFDENAEDPKTKLQEITQAKNGCVPVYDLISSDGPDHSPTFVISLKALEETVEGTGPSRKIAETDAARKFLQQFPQHKV